MRAAGYRVAEVDLAAPSLNGLPRGAEVAKPLKPGSTIGILGGGQLGRMLAIAAARLGFRVHIYEPAAFPPAGAVAAEVTRAAYDDKAALRAFAPGSVFRAPAGSTGGGRPAIYGRLVELATVPDRTIYYNGLTLPLWGAWEVGNA